MDKSASGISAIYHDLSPDATSISERRERGKKVGMKVMPLNPLTIKPNLRKFEPSRTASASSPLSERSREARAFKLSDEDTMRICDRYVDRERKWWAFAWRFMRRYWPHHLWLRHFRKIQVVGSIALLTIMAVLRMLYQTEMAMFASLSAKDQRDYQHLRWTLRGGEFLRRYSCVMESEDPLNLLPPAEQVSRFLDHARKQGWTATDIDSEQRKWPSQLESFDPEHAWYWSFMYLGRVLNGGSVQSWNPYSPDQGFFGPDNDRLEAMKAAHRAAQA